MASLMRKSMRGQDSDQLINTQTNKIIMINTQRFRVKRERRAKPALDCLGRLRRRDKAFCKSLKKG